MKRAEGMTDAQYRRLAPKGRSTHRRLRRSSAWVKVGSISTTQPESAVLDGLLRNRRRTSVRSTSRLSDCGIRTLGSDLATVITRWVARAGLDDIEADEPRKGEVLVPEDVR